MAATFDIAVIGLGYVGLPLAVAAAEVGLRVLGVDLDGAKVEAVNRGESYIQDVSAARVQAAREAGFVAAQQLNGSKTAEAYSICVPTPLRNGVPNIDAVLEAAGAIGAVLRRGDLVVLESTSYPGTTEEVVKPILAEVSGLEPGAEFGLAFSPERIDPGNEEWTLRNTPKIVAGIDARSTERAAALYGKFCERVVSVAGTREAELAKLIENTYRHVNIALVNELAMLARVLEIDVWEALRAAATKPFGYQPFYPGPGVGGHCIPVDPSYLLHRVREVGREFRLVELAQRINANMPAYVVERVAEMLGQRGVPIEKAVILVLGVAYKPDVADTRESPALPVISNLLALGAEVEYSDPYLPRFEVDGATIPSRDDPIAAAGETDLVVLMTAHRAFDIVAICEAARGVLDTRGVAPKGLATPL